MLASEVANAYVAPAYAEMAADKDQEAEAKARVTILENGALYQ
jgi:hypothetical protein